MKQQNKYNGNAISGKFLLLFINSLSYFDKESSRLGSFLELSPSFEETEWYDIHLFEELLSILTDIFSKKQMEALGNKVLLKLFQAEKYESPEKAISAFNCFYRTCYCMKTDEMILRDKLENRSISLLISSELPQPLLKGIIEGLSQCIKNPPDSYDMNPVSECENRTQLSMQCYNITLHW